jgi:hypothetical protein
LPASRGFDREHVPSVLGDDVGHDEINLVLGVGVDASPASVRTYLVDDGGRCEWTLPAPATSGGPTAQFEVETFAVLIRLGDSEAQTCCLAHERQLGQFSQGFAGGAWGGL